VLAKARVSYPAIIWRSSFLVYYFAGAVLWINSGLSLWDYWLLSQNVIARASYHSRNTVLVRRDCAVTLFPSFILILYYSSVITDRIWLCLLCAVMLIYSYQLKRFLSVCHGCIYLYSNCAQTLKHRWTFL
jgi:hypothetical protein